MAVVNGYCSVDQLREHLGDSGSKIDIDLLERSITSASRAVDSFTNRRFWQDPTVQIRMYRPRDPYVASVDDISSTTGLIIEGDSGGDYLWADVWSATDYDLEPRNADKGNAAFAWWKIVAVGDFTFPVFANRRTLRVTAKFGWSAIPADVEYATLLKAAALFRRKDAPFGIAGVGDFGPMRITRKDPDVIELLQPFQRFGDTD